MFIIVKTSNEIKWMIVNKKFCLMFMVVGRRLRAPLAPPRALAPSARALEYFYFFKKNKNVNINK